MFSSKDEKRMRDTQIRATINQKLVETGERQRFVELMLLIIIIIVVFNLSTSTYALMLTA